MTKNELFAKLPALLKDDKILLLTHTDMDGSGPVVLLKTLFKDVSVRHCTNAAMSTAIRNAVFNSDEFDKIVVCDISCTDEDAEIINKCRGRSKLVLLDHHLTAMGLNQYDWAIVQDRVPEDSYRAKYYSKEQNGSTSGTSLLYDYLEECGFEFPNKAVAESIVNLIAGYDTWDWVNCFNSEPIYNDFNTLFTAYGAEIFEERCIEKIANGGETIDAADKLILRIEQAKIDAHLENAKRGVRSGNMKIEEKYYSCALLYTDKYLNPCFDMMQSLYPELDLYIINYGTGISVRTGTDVNVGLLVKAVGGGGHAGAGGVKVDRDMLDAVTEKTLNGVFYPDK